MALHVNEIFTSFQGEGVHTGLPTVFIRLAGCNLRCLWCDTKYALSTKKGDEMEVDDIFSMVKKDGVKLACLTGGEPLLQSEACSLVRALIDEGIDVDVETNGSIDISNVIMKAPSVMISIDVKTPSSEEENSFLNTNFHLLRPSDQMKFIIKDEVDLQFALDIIDKFRPPCHIIFTPVDNKGGDRIAERLLDLIKIKDLSYNVRLMIQTHKVLWDTETRGV